MISQKELFFSQSTARGATTHPEENFHKMDEQLPAQGQDGGWQCPFINLFPVTVIVVRFIIVLFFHLLILLLILTLIIIVQVDELFTELINN